MMAKVFHYHSCFLLEMFYVPALLHYLPYNEWTKMLEEPKSFWMKIHHWNFSFSFIVLVKVKIFQEDMKELVDIWEVDEIAQ